MNRFNKYDMTNISFDDIDGLMNDYLNQVDNKYLKKVAIDIKNNDLIINIEPYYSESNNWNKLIELLKQKKVNFWFRDDDVGIDDDGLEVLINYMNKLNINLFIAAIPTKTNNILATKLKKYQNICIGQHGYSHTNYSLTEQSEYPNERDKEDVKKELCIGRDKLKEEFGEKFLNVFIPPWFEIDKDTLKLIKQENYNAISNFWDNHINEFGLIESNCQVDLVNWDKAYTFGGEEFVLEQIIKELEKNKTEYNIGILLHHERMGKESYRFLDKLIKIINVNASIVSVKNVINVIGKQND